MSTRLQDIQALIRASKPFALVEGIRRVGVEEDRTNVTGRLDQRGEDRFADAATLIFGMDRQIVEVGDDRAIGKQAAET